MNVLVKLENVVDRDLSTLWKFYDDGESHVRSEKRKLQLVIVIHGYEQAPWRHQVNC